MVKTLGILALVCCFGGTVQAGFAVHDAPAKTKPAVSDPVITPLPQAGYSASLAGSYSTKVGSPLASVWLSHLESTLQQGSPVTVAVFRAKLGDVKWKGDDKDKPDKDPKGGKCDKGCVTCCGCCCPCKCDCDGGGGGTGGGSGTPEPKSLVIWGLIVGTTVAFGARRRWMRPA